MYNLGAAVIGTGFIGPVHVEALRRLGIEVVGVLGSSASRSQQAAQQMGIPRAYASLDELLGDARAQVAHMRTAIARFCSAKRFCAVIARAIG